MPDDRCNEQPCKGALDKYQVEIKRGRGIQASVKQACGKRKALGDILWRLTVIWLALFAATILCMALVLPEVFCYRLTIAFYIVSGMVTLGLGWLTRLEIMLNMLRRACDNAEWEIFLAREEARQKCPPSCVPDIVYLKCDC